MGRKRINSGVLCHAPTSWRIDTDQQELFFDLLKEFDYDDSPPEQQIMIERLASIYCEIMRIEDIRRDDVHNQSQERGELLPQKHKDLLSFIASLREERKRSPQNGDSELDQVLSRIVQKQSNTSDTPSDRTAIEPQQVQSC